MEKILVSACLLGQPVRYNGKAFSFKNHLLGVWQKEGRIVSLCPEMASGFPVPRPSAEIEFLREGSDILAGSSQVFEDNGDDVTALFVEGAQIALDVAIANNCRFALLTDGSPSCGSTFIYDGTFNNVQKQGAGVVAALLVENGIRVFSQRNIGELADALKRLSHK